VEVRYAWEYDDPDHRRPAEVARLEAFLNTVDRHRFGEHAGKPADRRELLATPERLAAWLADQGLLDDPGARVGPGDLRRARHLRDGLRAWLRARQGLDHDPGEVERARELLGGLRLQVGLGDATCALAPAGGPAAVALERLAADLAMAAATGALARLKICGAPDCQFVYYDRSRSRTSRWCSTEVCGNRMKTRRYRERRRG
jgi:predicted RNA-binding Zn ribbon-like protein